MCAMAADSIGHRYDRIGVGYAARRVPDPRWEAVIHAAIGFLVIDQLGLSLGESQAAIGIVLMVGAGAALLVQWGLIPLLNLPPRNMVIIGLVFAATGTGLTGMSESLYGIACAYALACVGFGFTRPGFTAGSSLAVDRHLQGAVAGRVTSVNGAACATNTTTQSAAKIVLAAIAVALRGFSFNTALSITSSFKARASRVLVSRPQATRG